jgi:hypothetical protein
MSAIKRGSTVVAIDDAQSVFQIAEVRKGQVYKVSDIGSIGGIQPVYYLDGLPANAYFHAEIFRSAL